MKKSPFSFLVDLLPVKDPLQIVLIPKEGKPVGIYVDEKEHRSAGVPLHMENK